MFKFERLETVDSTNVYAKEHFIKNMVYYTKNQTNGAGRNGNIWHDSEGNLAITFCLEKVDMMDQAVTVMALGLSLCQMFEDAKMKWPNDVMIADKKIAGILAEAFDKRLIVGIGINVNNVSFVDEIEHKATSLRLENEDQFDLDKLTKELAENYAKNLKDLNVEKINEIQYLKDKELRIDGMDLIFRRVDKHGRAILEEKNGREIVYTANEISLSSVYKQK